jgi:hypothetical protein
MAEDSMHISFICEEGELELKSLLLAYSLKLQGIKNLYVLVPDTQMELLHRHTIETFQKLNTRIISFRNTFIEHRRKLLPGDKMSNKTHALRKMWSRGNIWFLDSDIICLDSFGFNLDEYDLAAKPADFAPRADWPWIFRQKGIIPSGKTVHSTVGNEELPPYFNAGVMWLNKHVSEILLNAWEEFFISLSHEEMLESGRFDVFHRDQIALSLAIESLSLNYYEFEESMNFPARRRMHVDQSTCLAHYHDAYTINRIPDLICLVQKFINEYPIVEGVFSKRLEWKYLVNGSSFLFALHEKLNKISSKINQLKKHG